MSKKHDQPLPLFPDRPVTWNEISQLAMEEPAVYQGMMMMMKFELSKEDALMLMVYVLSKQRQMLTKMLEEYLNNNVSRPIIMKLDKDGRPVRQDE